MRTHVRHTLLAWVLWQAVSGVISTSVDFRYGQPLIMDTFETKEECIKKAARYRMDRNDIVRNDQPHIPVWVCLPAGAPPETASYE
jgi:hypothetical protein